MSTTLTKRVAWLLLVLGLWLATGPGGQTTWAHGGSDIPSNDMPTIVHGLTVSAVGSVHYPADRAYLITIPDYYFGDLETELFIARQGRQALLTALEGVGLSEEVVDFTGSRHDPLIIKIEISIDQLEELKPKVIDILRNQMRQRIHTMGMTYALSPEHCQEAASDARQQAILTARQTATNLASLLDVQLGVVSGVREYPVAATQHRTKSDICAIQNYVDYLHSDLMDIESIPEVKVSIGLQITYLME